jgi:hypothetical protein
MTDPADRQFEHYEHNFAAGLVKCIRPGCKWSWCMRDTNVEVDRDPETCKQMRHHDNVHRFEEEERRA